MARTKFNIKKRNILLLSIIIIISITLFFADYLSARPNSEQHCYSTEEHEVRGTSLTGVINERDTIKLLNGYYNCNEIKKNEIIAYNYSGNENLIIKIVKAIPGDNFSLREEDNHYNIWVNGNILANSKNEPYILNENTKEMLALYEKDYEGIIPPEAYLILGNIDTGTLDSTKFGLVHKDQIIGKVKA